MNVIVDLLGLAGILLIALTGVLTVGYLKAEQLRHDDHDTRDEKQPNERKQS
jgi:hypothetical protein